MTWFNILKELDIPQKHREAQERERAREASRIEDYMQYGDIDSTNTSGEGDVGECCRQLVYDYFFNMPEPFIPTDSQRQEYYDWYTSDQDNCDYFVGSLRKRNAKPFGKDSSRVVRDLRKLWLAHQIKILDEYDRCVSDEPVDDSSGTIFRSESWKDIIKIQPVVRAEQEDECCKKIRNIMKNSPDWRWDERALSHTTDCYSLRAYLESIAEMEPTDDGYNFNRKASASRLLAAWAECERVGSTKPLEFNERTQRKWT